jgi:hypothetical protein
LSKYKAVKSVVNGVTFDSRAEARRYHQLLELQGLGEIQDLELQPVFILAPSVKFVGSARAKPALRYFADFKYTQMGEVFVEDVKSEMTKKLPAYKIKKHLMLSVHGINVVETS